MKTNPRRRPATQADVTKARNEGIRIACKVTLFVLRNYFGFGKTRLVRFWDHFESMCEEIGRGELKVKDIDQALLDEYGIEVD